MSQRDPNNWQTDETTEHPSPDVRVRLQRILLMSDLARCKDDYEFLDRYVHRVTYFADLPPRDRIKYLRIVKGVELEKGDEIFHIGDSADAFYCVMYGSLNVVVDFAHMAAPSVSNFDEIINRARIHSTFLNPGGAAVSAAQSTCYVVKSVKPLECFGDVGLLTSDQLRTASVVANEKTLCMKIDREAFLDLRKSYTDRELREKIKFLASVTAFDHWDADNILRLTARMERVNVSYNDIVVKESEPASHCYFVKHGECRLVKRFSMLRVNRQPCQVELCSVSSRHYFGAYEILTGAANAEFSALVSSPSAILYRMDRVDFRQTVLKDPTTEAMMRSECMELAQRINVDRVRADLERDILWSQYKHTLVKSILEKHQQDHALPLHGQRSPRQFHIMTRSPEVPTTPPAAVVVTTHCSAIKSPREGKGRGARRPVHHTGRVIVDPQRPSPQPPNPHKRNSRWLEWAKQRANQVVRDTNDSESSSQENSSVNEFKSNIQWSKSSKIMGGLDSEAQITSAIVSLFNPNDVHSS